MEELKNAVIDTANQFSLDAMPDEEDSDDPGLSGHSLHHLLSKARTFKEGFRERRLPNAPNPESLDAAAKAKAICPLKTYARRIIRATVPTAKQKRAKWRNFATRSSKKLSELIRAGEVRLFASWLTQIVGRILLFLLSFRAVLYTLKEGGY